MCRNARYNSYQIEVELCQYKTVFICDVRDVRRVQLRPTLSIVEPVLVLQCGETVDLFVGKCCNRGFKPAGGV